MKHAECNQTRKRIFKVQNFKIFSYLCNGTADYLLKRCEKRLTDTRFSIILIHNSKRTFVNRFYILTVLRRCYPIFRLYHKNVDTCYLMKSKNFLLVRQKYFFRKIREIPIQFQGASKISGC